MAEIAEFNIGKGNLDHAHMLGCGYAWFSQTYPEEWARIGELPAREAIEQMIAFMEERSRWPAIGMLRDSAETRMRLRSLRTSKPVP